MENQADIIKKRLFREDGTTVYAVLDGASIENLLQMFFKYEPQYLCLYQGDLEPDMAEVAPYLIRLDRDTAFTDWLLETGWEIITGFLLLPSATSNKRGNIFANSLRFMMPK